MMPLNTLHTNSQSVTTLQYKSLGIISLSSLFLSLFFIFSIPWGNAVWDGLSRIFGLLAFGAVGLAFISGGTRGKFSVFHLIIALLSVWFMLSLIWTPDFDRGEFLLKTTLQLILLTLMVTLNINDNRNHILLFYHSYILGNLVGSGIIIYNYLNGIESIYYQRYAIPTLDIDGQSIMLTLAIPMAAYLTTQYQSKFIKFVYILAIPTIVFAVFLTGTRTASIVGIIGVLYWLMTYRNSSFKIKITFFILFVASMITAVSLAPQESLDRILSSGQSISSGTLNNRTVIWGASLEQWKLSPVIGNGIGSLEYMLNTKHVEYDSAHSTYIHLLTENGLIGLGLYLFMIISIIYYGLNTSNSEKLFLMSLLLTILVSQITQHTHFHKETWFALTMLAVHAYHSYTHKNTIE